MRDLFVALVSIFLLEPMQAQIAERLAAARVPPAAIAQVRECATAAVPAIIDRALGDPWWAASSAIGLSVGLTNSETFLIEAAPGCAAALDAARRSRTEQSS